MKKRFYHVGLTDNFVGNRVVTDLELQLQLDRFGVTDTQIINARENESDVVVSAEKSGNTVSLKFVTDLDEVYIVDVQVASQNAPHRTSTVEKSFWERNEKLLIMGAIAIVCALIFRKK